MYLFVCVCMQCSDPADGAEGYTCWCVGVWVHAYICIYVHIYIYTHKHIYIYIYIYIYVARESMRSCEEGIGESTCDWFNEVERKKKRE